jgi:hypothetical protein
MPLSAPTNQNRDHLLEVFGAVRIKDFGTHDGHQVLFYTNNDNGQEEKSSVKEVREWYNRTQLTQVSTQLTQASNAILPTRKGYINSIAEASFKAIQQYDVKLPNKNVKKPTSFKKAGNSEQPQWFQAEIKVRKDSSCW